MPRYWTFFTNLEGEQETGGSHFNLYEISRGVEMFLSINPTREFSSVAVCRQEEDGSLTELARWNKGSTVPVFDIRDPEEMKRVGES